MKSIDYQDGDNPFTPIHFKISIFQFQFPESFDHLISDMVGSFSGSIVIAPHRNLLVPAFRELRENDVILRVNEVAFADKIISKNEFLTSLGALSRPLQFDLWRVDHDQAFQQQHIYLDGTIEELNISLTNLDNGGKNVNFVDGILKQIGIRDGDLIIGLNFSPIHDYQDNHEFLLQIRSGNPCIINILRRNNLPLNETPVKKFVQQLSSPTASHQDEVNNEKMPLEKFFALDNSQKDPWNGLGKTSEQTILAKIFKDQDEFNEAYQFAESIRESRSRNIIKEELYTTDTFKLRALVARERNRRITLEDAFLQLFQSIEEHIEHNSDYIDV